MKDERQFIYDKKRGFVLVKPAAPSSFWHPLFKCDLREGRELADRLEAQLEMAREATA